MNSNIKTLNTLKSYSILLILLIAGINTHAQKKPDEPTTYKDDLSFNWKKNEDTLRLIAKNKLLAPIQIYFYSRKDDSELNSFLLRPKDSIVLLKYKKKVSDSLLRVKINDSIRISYFIGHKDFIDPDPDYLYRFPFKKRKKYEVSQSFNGKSTHFSEKSRYAIDFQLNVGEAVHAARDGIVIKSIDWFTKQGGEELKNAANRIVIQHSDGTLASYVHLQYKGCLVKAGDRVIKGQKIGISGLTGHTNGPHLHFVVRKENDIAIPIYFKGYAGKVLKKGKRYKVID